MIKNSFLVLYIQLLSKPARLCGEHRPIIAHLFHVQRGTIVFCTAAAYHTAPSQKSSLLQVTLVIWFSH